MRYRLIISIFIVLLAVVHFIGCSKDIDNDNVYWFTDESGRFHTNDSNRASKELPISFILPTYLPSDIEPYPNIIGKVGPLKNQDHQDTIETETFYERSDGWRLVWIREYNYQILPPDPDYNPGIRFFSIGSIQVAEMDSYLAEYNGYKLLWNINDLYFEVAVYDYDHNEVLEIIESMIEQSIE